MTKAEKKRKARNAASREWKKANPKKVKKWNNAWRARKAAEKQ